MKKTSFLVIIGIIVSFILFSCGQATTEPDNNSVIDFSNSNDFENFEYFLLMRTSEYFSGCSFAFADARNSEVPDAYIEVYGDNIDEIFSFADIEYEEGFLYHDCWLSEYIDFDNSYNLDNFSLKLVVNGNEIFSKNIQLAPSPYNIVFPQFNVIEDYEFSWSVSENPMLYIIDSSWDMNTLNRNYYFYEETWQIESNKRSFVIGKDFYQTAAENWNDFYTFSFDIELLATNYYEGDNFLIVASDVIYFEYEEENISREKETRK